MSSAGAQRCMTSIDYLEPDSFMTVCTFKLIVRIAHHLLISVYPCSSSCSRLYPSHAIPVFAQQHSAVRLGDARSVPLRFSTWIYSHTLNGTQTADRHPEAGMETMTMWGPLRLTPRKGSGSWYMIGQGLTIIGTKCAIESS